MYQYKTVVTDYEGMQEALSTYGGQGWRAVSVTPDTWRVVLGKLTDGDTLGIGGEILDDATSLRELSASYYLLVFEREGDPEQSRTLEMASESLEFGEFSLPDY